MKTRELAKPITEILAGLEGAGAATPIQLRLRGEIDYDRLDALARYIGGLRDATAWWLGDLHIYTKMIHGDDAAYQVAESTGRSPDRMQQYGYVAENVAAQQRKPELSWTHHRHVAKLAPDDQDYWLQQAIEKRWTSGELHEQIKGFTGSATGNSGGGGGAGAPTVVEDLEQAARALVRVGNPDGNGFILVPVDAWARLIGALGEE